MAGKIPYGIAKYGIRDIAKYKYMKKHTDK
jgi:hypothetical protein